MTRSQRKAIRKILWKWPPKRRGIVPHINDPLAFQTRTKSYLTRFISEKDRVAYYLIGRYFYKASSKLKQRWDNLHRHYEIERHETNKRGQI